MKNQTKYAKVEGHSNLIRDLSTNAIINTDSLSADQYTRLRNRREIEKQKINNIEIEMSEIKSSIDELKHLLRNMLDGSKCT